MAVICNKESAFEMQFHLIIVSIFLKRCVKYHGEGKKPIAIKKDLISMYRGALVSGFVKNLVHLNE